MKQDLTLSSFISYRKGKATRKGPSSTGSYLPILTPEYLRTNAQVEDSTAADDSVVLNGSEIVLLWDGSNAGEFFRAKRGILASTMVVLDFDEHEFNNNYLFYALKEIEPLLKKQTAGSGIPHVDKQILLSLRIQKPLKTVQSKIAEVLSTVDRAVEQTEALIAKYQRIKTGLMHDLLTRGIDEHGQLRDPATHKFKDSPLGRIPEKWEVESLGTITSSAVDGPFGSNLKTEHYVIDNGVRVVRLQNIGIGKFEDSDQVFISREHAEKLKRHNVCSGDLLIAALGDENHPIARACLYPNGHPDGIVKADCFRFRLKKPKASHGYVTCVLNSPMIRSQIEKLGQGVTRDRINLSKAKSILIRVPQLVEQEILFSIFNTQNKLLKQQETFLVKLQKLKTGLMQDLLTGRVSVEPLLGPQNEDR